MQKPGRSRDSYRRPGGSAPAARTEAKCREASKHQQVGGGFGNSTDLKAEAQRAGAVAAAGVEGCDRERIGRGVVQRCEGGERVSVAHLDRHPVGACVQMPGLATDAVPAVTAERDRGPVQRVAAGQVVCRVGVDADRERLAGIAAEHMRGNVGDVQRRAERDLAGIAVVALQQVATDARRGAGVHDGARLGGPGAHQRGDQKKLVHGASL
mmetsp:Transcript_37550/g.87691  ORF Transcript_37550/g.87691 Transcript_37550/m.87691 type:complete len:211 (+) Transcript_37550:157-789(+)